MFQHSGLKPTPQFLTALFEELILQTLAPSFMNIERCIAVANISNLQSKVDRCFSDIRRRGRVPTSRCPNILSQTPHIVTGGG